MGHRDIVIAGKPVSPRKAFDAPEFESPTVLVRDPFDYVELWLARHEFKDAVLFWQQAKDFHRAAREMPRESRAVAAYYSALNAAKALLTAKAISYTDQHGLAGESQGNKTSLANEICTVKGSGVFVALASYYGASLVGKKASLKDLLYNIPFVHRAYTITFRGSENLFVPIENPHFVRQNGGSEAWFCAAIGDNRYCNERFMKRQRGWEQDKSELACFMIRSRHRFCWKVKGVSKKDRLEHLTKNHRYIRRDIKYIQGTSRLWYFKRNDKASGILHWPTPALVFATMHRLSELTRYDPKRLRRHFACQHNWLLNEFMNLATDNYIDQIACDITGQEFMVPGYRN